MRGAEFSQREMDFNRVLPFGPSASIANNSLSDLFLTLFDDYVDGTFDQKAYRGLTKRQLHQKLKAVKRQLLKEKKDDTATDTPGN